MRWSVLVSQGLDVEPFVVGLTKELSFVAMVMCRDIPMRRGPRTMRVEGSLCRNVA